MNPYDTTKDLDIYLDSELHSISAKSRIRGRPVKVIKQREEINLEAAINRHLELKFEKKFAGS